MFDRYVFDPNVLVSAVLSARSVAIETEILKLRYLAPFRTYPFAPSAPSAPPTLKFLPSHSRQMTSHSW